MLKQNMVVPVKKILNILQLDNMITDFLMGLSSGAIIIPINIILTWLAVKYTPQLMFMFIVGAMMINLIFFGAWVYILSGLVNLAPFMVGTGIIIIISMLFKVFMALYSMNLIGRRKSVWDL